jgi:hypothetical protein
MVVLGIIVLIILYPEHVDQWFDKEIEKLLSIDIKQIMKNCDGRDLNPGYQIGNLMS